MNSKLSLTACWILAIVLSLCVLLFANNESETNPEAEQHFERQMSCKYSLITMPQLLNTRQ